MPSTSPRTGTMTPAVPLTAAQERALELLRAGQRFLLVGHVRPDGDCLGSQAALVSVLEALGKEDPCLDIARNLARTALEDSYFVERKLYPNVDFYSGIIYSAMGIPVNMFTVMFALGRMPGWLAHWREMRNDPKQRINRPRQIYTGATERDYVSLDQRG